MSPRSWFSESHPTVHLQDGGEPRCTPRASRRAHFLAVLSVFLLTGTPSAQAMPPLMPATDVAQIGLVGWWRQGELLVGIPHSPERPGMRPLISPTSTPLPGDLSSWEPIGHECMEQPRAVALVNDQPVEGVVLGDSTQPVIALVHAGRTISQNTLGRPATVCEIRIVQADQLPGLELVVAWRTADPTPVSGITVFRIPEALQGENKSAPEED